MNPLERWTAAVIDELGVDAGALDRDVVLELAREVAHGVARPAAPLTTYLLGVAVGSGAEPKEAAQRVTRLAQSWDGEK